MQASGIHHGGDLIQEVQQLLSSGAAAGDVSPAKALDASTNGREHGAGSHAPLLKQAAKQAKRDFKAHLLALVHCSGYSDPVLVLSALGVQVLLKSPAVPDEAR